MDLFCMEMQSFQMILLPYLLKLLDLSILMVSNMVIFHNILLNSFEIYLLLLWQEGGAVVVVVVKLFHTCFL